MADDIFADLVGIKPAPAATGPSAQNGSGMSGEDTVLPSPATGQSSPQHQFSLSGYPQPTRAGSKIPSEVSGGHTRADGKSADTNIEKALAGVLERFAKGIQQALEDTNRYVLYPW